MHDTFIVINFDVTTDEVLARARRVIRNPEAAAEAARTCPGDFI